MIKFKPVLSIQKIGYLKFFLGIIFGIGYSILINFWLRIIDYGFYAIFDLFNDFTISHKAFYISAYNSLLLSSISTAIGFSFTMYIWSSSFIFNKRDINYKNRFSHTNSFFIAFLVLFFINRMLAFNTGLRYDEFGIDLKTEYNYLTFLLSIFIFFFNWNTISKVFKTGKFIFFSAITIGIFSIILSKIQIPSILLTGSTNIQLKNKIDKENKELKLITKRISGKWTNEKFSLLPPPPQLKDTIEDPFYKIIDNQITFNFYCNGTSPCLFL